DADRELLLEWIKKGCPKGDDKDQPAPGKFAKWFLESPDREVTMKETFTIPAQAPAKGIGYQHFALPANFTEDVWVQAVEARPGNRAVVHHMVVYIGDKPPMGEEQSADRDVLVAYVPAASPQSFRQAWPSESPREPNWCWKCTTPPTEPSRPINPRSP
ncbi:MAG: hypothetical protein HYR84_09695, partial [Planctomycetes bacterium]|nr:hypothetical protein [Planctomycetota bacterium]